MKTILHLIETSGPGGAETVFLNLFRAFNGNGFRSIALVTANGFVARALAAEGVTPYTCDAKGSFNVGYLREIIRIVRAEKVDLIQAHLAGAGLYASVAGALTRVPVVSLFHGSVDLPSDARLLWVKTAAINAGSDRIVAVSRSLQEDLLTRIRLSRSKLRVIYNGVDTARFRRGEAGRLRDELGLAPADLLACSIGNIRRPKGYVHLLEAAHHLAGGPRPMHFAIAGHGSGQLYEELLELRRRWQLEARVHFLGFRDDPVNILLSSDIFVLPSTSEGFSISTIEAMACGLPAVVTRSGGPEEIVTDGVDGCLVPPGSGECLAMALEGLAADPDRRRRLGTAARETVANRFSLEAMTEAYGSMYRELLGA